ncbi:MAG: hypothetical protein MUE44_05665 [Oscillatoriaceae cyanobacterium Prado104]|nr:hypothetical protein [Oscillatoriaceae cyanobacterium Prado104]
MGIGNWELGIGDWGFWIEDGDLRLEIFDRTSLSTVYKSSNSAVSIFVSAMMAPPIAD